MMIDWKLKILVITSKEVIHVKKVWELEADGEYIWRNSDFWVWNSTEFLQRYIRIENIRWRKFNRSKIKYSEFDTFH